jgi:hypothetical protein
MDGVLDLPTSNNTDMASDREREAFEIEQRFLLTHAQTVAFLRAVSAHTVPELHDRARPLSFTRTTYLDSVDLAYLRSCAGRVARRLRLREYALASTLVEPPLLTGDCFFELKESAGTVRSKIRLAAPRVVVERIIDGTLEVDSALDCLAEPGAQEALAALQAEIAARRPIPCLTTWYRRSSLTADDGRVRLTLDQGLSFCEPQQLGDAGDVATPSGVIARGPARILEIKRHGCSPAWLEQATAGLVPAPSFSKFQMGMVALRRRAA